MKQLNQVSFLYDSMIKYYFLDARSLVVVLQNELSLLNDEDLITESTQHLSQIIQMSHLQIYAFK